MRLIFQGGGGDLVAVAVHLWRVDLFESQVRHWRPRSENKSGAFHHQTHRAHPHADRGTVLFLAR